MKREAERAASRAEKIAAKEKRKAEKEADAVKQKSIRGIMPSLHGACVKATKFDTLEDAAVAARRYAAVKKHPIEGFKCEKCEYFHIRCDEVPLEAARQRAIKARLGSARNDDLASGHAETHPNYAERLAR